MLGAFNIVLEFSIVTIPGGAGTRAAVQAAMALAQNGLEASSFFGGWVGPACGVPDWHFDLYNALLQAPDSIGVSTSCRWKTKADCKRLDPVPDPPKRGESTNRPTVTKDTSTNDISDTKDPGKATTAGMTTSPSDIISQTPARSTESHSKTSLKATTSSVASHACQYPDLQAHTQSYRGLPDLALVKQALVANGNKPSYPFAKVERVNRGTGEGRVRAEYFESCQEYQ
ncbi:hypothetical protein DL769_009147 [Monosporascus sp. CRB-8-3]|nr:hypothetical protein DL769_009147 [Monosporascus sp. CRB-8-3]